MINEINEPLNDSEYVNIKPTKLKPRRKVIKRKLENNNVLDIKTKIKKEIVSDDDEMNEPFGNLSKPKSNVRRKMRREQIKFSDIVPKKEKKTLTLDEMDDRYVPKIDTELISRNANSAKIVKKLKSGQEKQEQRRKHVSDTRKLNRNTNVDNLRENNGKNQTEMVTFSPEDFDDDSKYNIPGVKRSRISLPLTSIERSIRKIKARKYKSDVKKGEGIERKFIPYSENIVYEYYDDPNELCDRLRLLVSSKSAGNTNHVQEINSIVEELRERDIIV